MKEYKGHVVKDVSISVNEAQRSITITGTKVTLPGEDDKGKRYLSMTFEEALKLRNELYAMEGLDECQPG